MRILVATALLLAACNTPGRRIEKNQRLFDTYPPDVQAAIRAGRVEKGFDTNQAYMAVGNPDRSETRGDALVWYFTTVHSRRIEIVKDAVTYENERLEYEKAKAEGKPAVEPKPTYVETEHRTRAYRIITFRGGRVVTVENPQGHWLDDWH